MSNPQNPYPGYGQQPPQGYGGYGQPAPGQAPPYGAPPMGTGNQPPVGGGGGSSRLLPIMVAAGLAVGVCGGLILVLGTGKSDAATTDPVAANDDGETADAGVPDATAVVEKPVDAAPAKPANKKVTLSFEVDPADATITVDGEELDGDKLKIELEGGEPKTVKIKAEAKGYKSKSVEHEVSKNDTVEIKLDKARTRSSGGSKSGGSKSGGKGGRKGGRIDL